MINAVCHVYTSGFIFVVLLCSGMNVYYTRVHLLCDLVDYGKSMFHCEHQMMVLHKHSYKRKSKLEKGRTRS